MTSASCLNAFLSADAKSARVGTNLALVHQASPLRMNKFDRVLNTDDVDGTPSGYRLSHARQRCALALHRSRQSPVPGRLSRHTSDPTRESVPTTLDRRSQKGYVGNSPQSHLTHSTHSRDTGRDHRTCNAKSSCHSFSSFARCPSFKASITSLLVSSADSTLLFGERLDDTSDPYHRWRPCCQMKIRSALLGGKHQKIDQVMFLHSISNRCEDSSSRFPSWRDAARIHC